MRGRAIHETVPLPGEAPATPWTRATQKRRSMRSEREGAKLDGGQTTANSGAGRFKGDYRANGAMIDDKYTDARSFSIKLDGDQGFLAHIKNAVMGRALPEWRITLPGLKLRVLREEDYLYLRAKADSGDED